MKGDTSMKIVDKTGRTMAAFEEVCIGELFRNDKGDIFIRISGDPLMDMFPDLPHEEVNCFCLTTDEVCFFDDSELVEKIEAKLTIYHKN